MPRPAPRRRRRSIPAQAGEPPRSRPTHRGRSVYPRTGGGTLDMSGVATGSMGLSPHRRGNQASRRARRPRTRSIPAQAGEPGGPSPVRRPVGVYPRTGGGTIAVISYLDCMNGLSPHRRGNQGWPVVERFSEGSIPAQAGEPKRLRRRARHGQVYPRTGGGTVQQRWDAVMIQGLSPHRRGNRLQRRPLPALPGSIPAQAGEPFAKGPAARSAWVYPRTGGGTSQQRIGRLAKEGLSPHRRGNQLPAALRPLAARSIPAQAGEPLSSGSAASQRKVYPRTGGGTSRADHRAMAGSGLSPHRRGNPRILRLHGNRRRSIPAQAGEPPPKAR